MTGKILKAVRARTPLVHCITNYVTVNDCANALIACGGAPIMADDLGEAAEITAICSGLVINIGTLNKNTIPAMFAAGKRANELNHSVLLDPVGAGASALRTDTAKRLIDEVRFSVIRGNVSEIKALAVGGSGARGVDADIADAVTDDSVSGIVSLARDFSRRTGAVTAITGATDIVSDGEKTYVIKNGHPMMAKITGSGCMLSAVTGAFIAANPSELLDAAAAAVIAMGLCGELAFDRSEKTAAGNSTYRNLLIDALSSLDAEVLNGGAKYEIF